MQPSSAPSAPSAPLDRTGRRRRVLVALLALGILLSLAVPGLSAATTSDPNTPGGVTPTQIARGSFPDDVRGQFRIKQDRATKVVNINDASDMMMVRLVFAPGGSVGWHTHPGPVLVAVNTGELTVVNASDCVRRVYKAGQAFVDPGQGNIHVGFNATAGETVVHATFLEVPKGSGPTIPMTHDHGRHCNL
jgi:quercetin dioxygenase-like cupin family protein